MKKYWVVLVVAVISLFVFWMPFLVNVESFWGINFGRKGMETIASNFDGLNFLVVEKSWYDPGKIEKINTVFLTGNDPIYFTAHYPLFAGVVWLFDLMLAGPQALFAAIIFSNLMLAGALYWFYEELTGKANVALMLSIIALFLPARMLSVRGVASTEMLFMALTLGSLTYYMKGKSWRSSILGALAVLTRSPGILLFVGYGLTEVMNNRKSLAKAFSALAPYLLIPLSLIGLWVFYGFQYGSFWAYFQSGDNLHIFFPPFQFFSNVQSWVSGMWLEDAIYIYLLFSFGVYGLFRQYRKSKQRAVLNYALIYLAVIMLVAHRDISRYSLPIAPIVIAGFASVFRDKKIRWILLVMLLPIYLLGWNFVLQNVQPVNNWGAFL